MASIKTIKDEITGALKYIQANVLTEQRMAELLGTGNALIQFRTQAGVDANEQAFTSYSRKRYYAPIDRRPPGHPAPAGGRTTRKGSKSKKKMKTMAFDDGYGKYKEGIGRGALPQISITGKTLADISPKVISPSHGQLYFASRESAEKAHGHITGANHLPVRMFFGFSARDEATLAADLQHFIDETVRKSGAG